MPTAHFDLVPGTAFTLMEIDHPDDPSPFGPVIYGYSRAQAIADGLQIQVSKVAAEAGIRFPVFLTRAVYEGCHALPKDSRCLKALQSMP